MGGVQAGLYCRLKSPLADWKNGDQGGVRFYDEGGRVLFRASSGPRTLRQGEELSFSFRLLPTPLKPLDPQRWNTRFAHAYRPVEEILASGATVVNIHHDTLPNLYINYPFLNLDLLTPYVSQAHTRELKVKVYYTVRELTTHLPELWAFRSLGDEIYRTSGTQGHGNPRLDFWLQEHLKQDYTPAWITRTPAGDIDAATRVFFDSRLDNFYLEGLKWLLENVPIDGIYLDEIGYTRDIMQRVRRVLDLRPGAMIDLHGNRDWWSCNSPIGYYMEHLPYVDRLWFGEAFNPNSPPDFWLVEMSGIPFGLSSDMLQNPNPWRGMLFGMTARAFYGGGAQSPTPIWKLWDQFGIQNATMIGWWDSAAPIRTGRSDVLATVYRRPGKSLVAIASWAAEPTSVRLNVDWKQLGIDEKQARIVAPAIANVQDARTFLPGEAIPVVQGKGWLLVIDQP
jgi:glycosyl hydrolase family 123